MAILTVGTGQQFSTIAAAVNASSSGDTVDVMAGTYTNDFVTIGHNLTLQAVGGMVTMNATVAPPNGKAIIDEGGAGVAVKIDGFELTGAVVADANGAGVRYEGGTLTLSNDYVHGNQEGILGAADPNGAITIDHSEFAANGAGDGYSHNIYIGDIANFTLTNSLVTGAIVGHEVKSRAQNNTIQNNVIADGPGSTASYSIDLANGGNATISGNVVEKAATAQNPIFITSGEEGVAYSSNQLSVTGNTFINNDGSPSVMAVRNLTGTTAQFSANSVSNLTAAQLGSGLTATNTTYLSVMPALNLSAPYSVASNTSTPTPTPTPSPTPTPTPTPTPASPPPVANVDTINISVASLMRGNTASPSFVVSVDGKQVGGTQTVATVGAAFKTLSLTGDWAAGSHSIVVSLLGATAANRENLLIGSMSYDGQHVGGRYMLAAGQAHDAVQVNDTTALFKT